MRDLRLTNAAILNSEASTFRRGLDVIIRDGTIGGIVEAHTPVADDSSFDVLDLGGAFITPGLIDSHYHLISRSDTEMDVRAIATSMIEGTLNAHDCISSGVTSVRDCGCRHEGVYSLRQAISEGTIAGPAPYVAGRNPTGTAAPAHWRNIVASGPEQFRAAVRSQVNAGADWVKLILAHADDPTDWGAVTEFITDEEISAAVAEAHALGIHIGGHCEGWDVAARAVRLGLGSLDHAPLISDEVAADMAARGTFYVPTVWAFSDDSGVDPAALGSQQTDALEAWRAEHRASVRRARAAGVRIATGTDSADALPGQGLLLNELRALEDCGLSRSEVLLAATATGAALTDRGGMLGEISIGYQADLLVSWIDPFDDLAALMSPQMVLQRGKIVFTSEGGIRETAQRQVESAASVARWS